MPRRPGGVSQLGQSNSGTFDMFGFTHSFRMTEKGKKEKEETYWSHQSGDTAAM